MLRVLLLGNRSFIGKHFAESIASDGNVRLTVFGRNPISQENSNSTFVRGDFEDAESVDRALKGQDIVYHFISQTIPSSSWDSPLTEIEKNLRPSLQLIELAARHQVKKICFASSGGTVYGSQEKSLTEFDLTEPYSPYGIIKRSVESFLQYSRIRNGTNYDIYRISNVYGEGQDIGKGLGFINTALENIINRRPVVIYGDGLNIRDYIYVKDVARLLKLSITKDFQDSQIYNLSSNHAISLVDLVKLIKKVTDIDFEVNFVQGRGSDIKKVVLNNSKIMEHFPGDLTTSLEVGIKNTFDSLKQKLAAAPRGT